ncbi:MAG: hypothetical protein K8R01_01595 [Methanococcoides sp.]|nr:hypothetical protein [Methanococcoides sp.]
MLNFGALYLVKELIKLGTYRSTILQRKLDGEKFKERLHVGSSSIIKSISLANMSQEHRESLNTSIGFPYMDQTNVFSELNEETGPICKQYISSRNTCLGQVFVEMHSAMT